MALVLTGSLALGGTGMDDLSGDLVVSAEITSFKVTGAVNTIEVPATMTTPIHGRGGATDYSVTITYLSNDIAGTMFRKLWTGLGSTVTFSGTMRAGSISATNPVWYGSFVVTEAALGGAAKTLSTAFGNFPDDWCSDQGNVVKFSVKLLSGEALQAQIIPADTVAFERHFGIGASKADADPRIEHAMFLAYTSLHRVGSAGDDFDSWLNTVEDIEPVEEVPLVKSKASSCK